MEELQIMADGDFSDDNLKIEFFYLSGVNMECPIEGCNGSRFASKTKYQRHWDEKHVSYVISYSCPVRKCQIRCGRRTDLKCHLKTVHREQEGRQLEELLSKATKSLRNNQRFIDPGLLVYKGRTKVIQTEKTPPSSVTVASSIPSSTVACTTLSPIFHVKIPAEPPSTEQKSSTTQPLMDVAIIPDTTPSSLTSRISVEEYKARRTVPDVRECPPAFDTHLGYSTAMSFSSPSADSRSEPVVTSCSSVMPSPSSGMESDRRMEPANTRPPVPSNTYLGCPILPTLPFQTQDSGTQTSCLDYPPFALPPIPDNRRELETYLRWLCSCIDVIGRQREAAKERLEEMRREGNQLDKERELRRKFEAENRRLKNELAEIKWRKDVFKDTEP